MVDVNQPFFYVTVFYQMNNIVLAKFVVIEVIII